MSFDQDRIEADLDSLFNFTRLPSLFEPILALQTFVSEAERQ